MIGMDRVAELRRSGLRPIAVFVQLRDVIAPAGPMADPLGHAGLVTVQIADDESLGDLDLRPLTGLKVCVESFTNDRSRLMDLAVRISKLEPSLLWCPEIDGSSPAVHVRRKGPPATSETYPL